MTELVEVRYLLREAGGLVERSVSGPAEAPDLAFFARRPGEPPLLGLTLEALKSTGCSQTAKRNPA